MSVTTIFLLFGAALAQHGGASLQKSVALAEEVSDVGMTVSDLDRASEFFTTVLTFEKISEAEYAGDDVERLYGLFGIRIRVATLRLGDETIELTEYLAPRGRPIPVDSRSQDRWFQHIAIITSDMDQAYQRLRVHKVRHASTGPQRLPDWNKNAGGIKAFYFHDPDDHVLEILQFPSGKGSTKWHEPSDRLFLGIDHTAIVVGDTEASLKFYRDVLGFEVAAESENHGTEQEHLNNVFGARLRITSVRPPVGPAIEFLEYLAPRDGRPYPFDARANDLYHWQTTVVTKDVNAITSRVRSGGFRMVSPGVVDLGQSKFGFRHGVLVRDPDGHVMRIVKK